MPGVRPPRLFAATGERDTETRRYHILLGMCPQDLESELHSQNDRLNTFDAVEARIREKAAYSMATRPGTTRPLASLDQGMQDEESVNEPSAQVDPS